MSNENIPIPKSPTSETLENHKETSVVETAPSFSSNPAVETSTAHKEEVHNTIKSSDALAKGISSTLSTVIKDFDSKAVDVVKSQDQLCFAIDRLTKELDQLLEDAPLPFIMQQSAKISGVRKRVSSLNSVLRSIQKRLDNIDRTVSVGLLHEKTTRESTGH